jgi:hypothetical protein
MNFALSVLEKKLKGKATEEERWRVDQLLRHALEMQEQLHGPLMNAKDKKGAFAVSASNVGALQSQLAAKETQLRAMEDRAASAEAALSRARGTALQEDDQLRTLAVDNRKLRGEVRERKIIIERRGGESANVFFFFPFFF